MKTEGSLKFGDFEGVVGRIKDNADVVDEHLYLSLAVRAVCFKEIKEDCQTLLAMLDTLFANGQNVKEAVKKTRQRKEVKKMILAGDPINPHPVDSGIHAGAGTAVKV